MAAPEKVGKVGQEAFVPRGPMARELRTLHREWPSCLAPLVDGKAMLDLERPVLVTDRLTF